MAKKKKKRGRTLDVSNREAAPGALAEDPSPSSTAVAEKLGRVNKTQAIRDYFADHPKAMPKDAAQALTEMHGVEFTPGMVSNIKSQMGKKRRPAGRPGRPRKPAAKTNADVKVDELLAAKRLAEQLGGVDKARHALDVLGKLFGNLV
jgi:hypothetical protein